MNKEVLKIDLNKELMDLSNIISKFVAEVDLSSIQSYGSGHINDTYYIKGQGISATSYLLQRINHKVFKDVPALMNNIRLVISHMRNKLQHVPGSILDNEVLYLIPTHFQACYYEDEDGNYWRMYKFIANTRSIDVAETKAQAYEGGVAIGKFQALLCDLDIKMLAYTIPRFHDIELRIEQFRDSLANDVCARKVEVLQEVTFALERAEQFSGIAKIWKDNQLPLRITHNDTKFNNILFNEKNQAQCIIDFDTVMPGYVAYDFGDAIRTIINSAAEDEAVLEDIKLNMELFEAFSEGYLKETLVFLTKDEIESLPLSVMLFPYMQAIRFLTDYLNGDIYYKTGFAGHNLQRARAQFELLRKIEQQYASIENIISRLSNQLRLIAN
jgi:hypothetical protein